MSSDTKCVICDGSISESDNQTFKRKAIEKVIESSIERDDNKHTILSDMQEVELHRQCHRAYISKVNIVAAKKRKLLSPDEKNKLLEFDYINLCIFCGEDASDGYIRSNIRKGKPKSDLVKNLKLGKSVGLMIDLAKSRDDEKHRLILKRLTQVPNLSAVEAKYHNDCHAYFFDPMSINPLMKFIEVFFEKNTVKRAFSLDEVLKGYHGPKFTEDEIEKKIKLILDEKIVVSKKPGEPLLLIDRKHFTEIMCARAEQQKINSLIPESEEEESMIMKAAGKIIGKDIDEYVDKHLKDNLLHDPEEDIPRSLKMFLEKLLLPVKPTAEQQRKMKNKIIAIAHAIICARRPEAFNSNLQLFMGKYLYDKTGSEEVIDILSALGIFASYDKIQQVQHSKEEVHDFLVKYKLLSLSEKKNDDDAAGGGGGDYDEEEFLNETDEAETSTMQE